MFLNHILYKVKLSLFCHFFHDMHLIQSRISWSTYFKSVLTVTIHKIDFPIHLYLNFDWVSVCLFVSNKRQNGWTDRAQILCRTSRDPMEGLWKWSKFKKINVFLSFHFVKFWTCAKNIVKYTNFFVIILYCKKRRYSQMKPQLKA